MRILEDLFSLKLEPHLERMDYLALSASCNSKRQIYDGVRNIAQLAQFVKQDAHPMKRSNTLAGLINFDLGCVLKTEGIDNIYEVSRELLKHKMNVASSLAITILHNVLASALKMGRYFSAVKEKDYYAPYFKNKNCEYSIFLHNSENNGKPFSFRDSELISTHEAIALLAEKSGNSASGKQQKYFYQFASKLRDLSGKSCISISLHHGNKRKIYKGSSRLVLMAEDLPTYARELQALAEKQGLNATEMARMAEVNEATFGSIYRGARKRVEDIYLSTRRKIYRTFPEAKSFHTSEFDPINLELDSPQMQLKKFIVQNYEGSVENFAKAAKINSSTIHSFICGKTKFFRSKPQQSIYEASKLECFNLNQRDITNESVPVILPSIQGSPDLPVSREDQSAARGLVATLFNIERGLSDVKFALAQNLPSYAALLHFNPNPQERMQLVEAAIDVLVEQMDYFKVSSQQERELLVKYLGSLGEMERGGYALDLLQRISIPGKTPETFARAVEAPKKLRKE